MRAWINLLEKATMAPDFESWFSGSKVVDEHGAPLLCYHGTLNTFDEFFSGSHFGDLSAAEQRIVDKKAEGYRFAGHSGIVHAVYLSIKNPLRIEDDRGLIDGYDLARAARKAGAISEEEEKALAPDWTTSAFLVRRRLFILLKEKGFDGMVYKNVVEGVGADSWIIFDTEQARHAG